MSTIWSPLRYVPASAYCLPPSFANSMSVPKFGTVPFAAAYGTFLTCDMFGLVTGVSAAPAAAGATSRPKHAAVVANRFMRMKVPNARTRVTFRRAPPRGQGSCGCATTRAVRLPDPCLVVLVGVTGAGKSHWAREWFEPEQVVSSDRLRAVVGL